jgi:hypothetical protein
VTRPLVLTLAALVAVVGAFVAGRYSAPTKTETRVEYVERLQIQRTRAVHRVVETQTRTRTIHVRTPDGTETTTTDTSTGTRDTTDSSGTTVAAKDTAGTKTAVVTQARASWHINALVGGGIDLSPRLSLQMSSDVGAGGGAGGAHIERRLLGPVWLGLWGVGSPSGVLQGGVSLGLEF